LAEVKPVLVPKTTAVVVALEAVVVPLGAVQLVLPELDAQLLDALNPRISSQNVVTIVLVLVPNPDDDFDRMLVLDAHNDDSHDDCPILHFTLMSDTHDSPD